MGDKENGDFVRQRRNLMSASIVLLFSELTGLQINEINIFGTIMHLSHPHAVTWVLWIASTYWLLRFYQYSRISPLLSSTRSDVYRNCKSIILKILRRDEPSIFVSDDSDMTRQTKISTKSLTLMEQGAGFLGFMDYKVELEKIITEKGSVKISQNLPERKVRIEGADLYLALFRSFTYTSIHTPLFTNLVLPYIVFALPVIYLCYKTIRQLI